MIHIYYKPHSSRLSERRFFNHLLSTFPEATVTTTVFPFPEYIADFALTTSRLIHLLQKDTYLAPMKRAVCLNLLSQCPDEIKVVQNALSISFDIILTAGELVYYWEFHEDQHRSLNVTRPQKIYDALSNQPITVPRFFQRFLRDIWRAIHFEPYTIVWKDWFEVNQSAYIPALQGGFHEYVLPNRFSFERLLAGY